MRYTVDGIHAVGVGASIAFDHRKLLCFNSPSGELSKYDNARNERRSICEPAYILKTPNPSLSSRKGAFSAAEMERASTVRVSAGSMMPSSQRLEVL